ncbi:hypothetical protein GGI43DRAFT_402205, partial [Trichoderma evansii]
CSLSALFFLFTFVHVPCWVITILRSNRFSLGVSTFFVCLLQVSFTTWDVSIWPCGDNFDPPYSNTASGNASQQLLLQVPAPLLSLKPLLL